MRRVRLKNDKIFIGIDELGYSYRMKKEKGRLGSIFVGWNLEEEKLSGFVFC